MLYLVSERILVCRHTISGKPPGYPLSFGDPDCLPEDLEQKARVVTFDPR